MIERSFVAEKLREYEIKEHVKNGLGGAGVSDIKIKKTPLGEKIVVYTSMPGLIVGKKGENIKRLTQVLKKKYNLENPQIEIGEIESPNLDSQIVADRIAGAFQRFGTNRFKAIGHKVLTDVMNAGALGIEIIVSGKIPSDRAKSWRFYQGYLKKCGEIATTQVKVAHSTANLKSGSVGIKVSIMPPDVKLPDDVKVIDEKEEVALKEEKAAEETAKEAKEKSKEKKGEAEKKTAEAKAAEPKTKKRVKSEAAEKKSEAKSGEK